MLIPITYKCKCGDGVACHTNGVYLYLSDVGTLSDVLNHPHPNGCSRCVCMKFELQNLDQVMYEAKQQGII